MSHDITDIAFQLQRYGFIASDALADVLWELTCVNDDMHHDRRPDLIVERIEETERLLAVLKVEVSGG